MAYPNYVSGNYGDEKVTSTTEDYGLTIGTRMVLPDGRVFRYAFSNGAAGAGTTVQSSIAIANHDNNEDVAAAAAVGATSVSLTLGATLATADQYANGYLAMTTAAGEGHLYRIRTHAAVASDGTGTFYLEDGDSIREALTTSSKFGLVANPYMHVIPAPAGAQTARCVGVCPAEVADNSYFWVQTWGEALCLVNGTLVIFTPVRVSDDTTAGSVEAYSSDTDAEEQKIGFATNVLAATTHYQFVFLEISP